MGAAGSLSKVESRRFCDIQRVAMDSALFKASDSLLCCHKRIFPKITYLRRAVMSHAKHPNFQVIECAVETTQSFVASQKTK